MIFFVLLIERIATVSKMILKSGVNLDISRHELINDCSVDDATINMKLNQKIYDGIQNENMEIQKVKQYIFDKIIETNKSIDVINKIIKEVA